MFRADLQWLYPRTAEEAASLLSGREVVPHAGGTGLLRTKPAGIRALVDLSGLPLRTREESGGEVRLGAMLTFADLAGAAGASSADPGLRLLAAALSRAAATPLRHRITLGGSAVDAAPWSDLTAPLLCLGAEVVLLRGADAERLPYAEYLTTRPRLAAHLVREVIVRKGSADVFALARLAMVRFDYAACHLAMAARRVDGRLEEPRFYLNGARGRCIRLEAVERAVAGRRLDEAAARRAAEQAEAAFASDPRFSAGYKARWTRVAVRDGLLAMAAGEGGHRG